MTTIITGQDNLRKAVETLIKRSARFTVVPWPMDEWELTHNAGEGHDFAIANELPESAFANA